MLDKKLKSKKWILLKKVISKKIILDVQKFLDFNRSKEFSELEKWFENNKKIKIPLKTSPNERYKIYQKILPKLRKELPIDLQHFLVGEFGLNVRLSNKIKNILCDKNLYKTFSKFFKLKEIYIHYPPMVRFNFGSPKSHVPSHQDYAYNKHLKDFVTVWVPLTKIDRNCPGLVLYEKLTKNQKKLKHKKDNFWAQKVSIKGLKGKHIKMNIGDILIFSKHLIHRSEKNIGKKVRYSFDLRFFTKKQDTIKSYIDMLSKKVIRKH